jgi:hypothetical protein
VCFAKPSEAVPGDQEKGGHNRLAMSVVVTGRLGVAHLLRNSVSDPEKLCEKSHISSFNVYPRGKMTEVAWMAL